MNTPISRHLASAFALLLATASPVAAQQAAPTAPTAEDRANPAKMASLMMGDWTTEIGRLTIRPVEGVFDRYVGHLYSEGDPEPKYVFDDLVPDQAGALAGTWRRGGATGGRAARFLVSLHDVNAFAAGLDGWTEPSELSGRRGYTSPRDALNGARLVPGNWCTEAGLLRVQMQQGKAVGAIYSDSGVLQYLMELAPTADGTALSGQYWAASDNHRHDATLASTRKGKAIVATLGGAEGWNGHRLVNGDLHSTGITPANDACAAKYPNPGTTPTPTPPPLPPPPPSPPPGPTPSEPAAGFQSLRKYDVRVDRVVVARDAQRIDVFVTLRNASQAPVYATSGQVMVRLEDSDGVGQVNGQILRPTVEGREQFASTPVIEPGGQLRAKYSFHPDSGTTPQRVIVAEGDKRAQFGA